MMDLETQIVRGLQCDHIIGYDKELTEESEEVVKEMLDYVPTRYHADFICREIEKWLWSIEILPFFAYKNLYNGFEQDNGTHKWIDGLDEWRYVYSFLNKTDCLDWLKSVFNLFIKCYENVEG